MILMIITRRLKVMVLSFAVRHRIPSLPRAAGCCRRESWLHGWHWTSILLFFFEHTTTTPRVPGRCSDYFFTFFAGGGESSSSDELLSSLLEPLSPEEDDVSLCDQQTAPDKSVVSLEEDRRANATKSRQRHRAESDDSR